MTYFHLLRSTTTYIPTPTMTTNPQPTQPTQPLTFTQHYLHTYFTHLINPTLHFLPIPTTTITTMAYFHPLLLTYSRPNPPTPTTITTTAYFQSWATYLTPTTINATYPTPNHLHHHCNLCSIPLSLTTQIGILYHKCNWISKKPYIL